MPAAGEEVNAEDVNVRLDEDELTADSSTWDDSPEVAVMSVTPALVDGQRYAIWAIGRVSGSAVGTAGIRIRENSGVAGTQLNFCHVYIGSTTGNGFNFYAYAQYTATADGPKTFSLTGQSTGGVHTQQLRASANAPALMVAERIVE